MHTACSSCRTGIYAIPWFDKKKWPPSDIIARLMAARESPGPAINWIADGHLSVRYLYKMFLWPGIVFSIRPAGGRPLTLITLCTPLLQEMHWFNASSFVRSPPRGLHAYTEIRFSQTTLCAQLQPRGLLFEPEKMYVNTPLL